MHRLRKSYFRRSRDGARPGQAPFQSRLDQSTLGPRGPEEARLVGEARHPVMVAFHFYSRNQETKSPPRTAWGGAPKRWDGRDRPVWYQLPKPHQGFRLEVKPKCELDRAGAGTLRSLNTADATERTRIHRHVGIGVIHVIKEIRERALKAQLKTFG